MKKNERNQSKVIRGGKKGAMLSLSSILVNIIVFIYSLNNMLKFQLIGINLLSQHGIYMITSYVFLEILIAVLLIIPPIIFLKRKRIKPLWVLLAPVIATILSIVAFDGYDLFLIPAILDFVIFLIFKRNFENSPNIGNANLSFES